MTGTLERRPERAEAIAQTLVSPPTVPDPVELFRAAFGEPDPWQIQALRSEAQQLALNVTRQGGKTGVACTLACHTALASAGVLVLLVSPSLRQSMEAFRRVPDAYRAAGRPILPEAENRMALELSNNSRVIALPGVERTIRGFAGVNLIAIDEASRVEDGLYASLRPMLAVSGGRLLMLSTPWGQHGLSIAR